MANYDWQQLKNTDIRWRDLHVRRHWAETRPDGTWAIYEGKGRQRSVKVAMGSEASRDVAERVIEDWERRELRKRS